MRKRLRPLPGPARLADLYAAPHRHDRWFDHKVRVEVTIAIAAYYLPYRARIVDLSCGDASIPRRLAQTCSGTTVLGDFAPGYEHTGPIEQTIDKIESGSADLWVLSETLEHLDDPDAVLRKIRSRARMMVLSTPDGETDPARNPEHVWGWDSEAVEKMLREAGFRTLVRNSLDLRPAGYEYCYQVWMVQ